MWFSNSELTGIRLIVNFLHTFPRNATLNIFSKNTREKDRKGRERA